MSNDIDPASSALSAFSDLAKRVLSFFGCVCWGLLIGIISSGVGRVINGATSRINENDFKDVDLSSIVQMPPIDVVLIGACGAVGLFYGLVTILKGTSKTFPYMAVILGAALLAIVVSSLFEGSLHLVIWLSLFVFIIFTYWFIYHWRTIKNRRWEGELNAIYEENRRIREEQEFIEQEDISPVSKEALENEEPSLDEKTDSPPGLKPEED